MTAFRTAPSAGYQASKPMSPRGTFPHSNPLQVEQKEVRPAGHPLNGILALVLSHCSSVQLSVQKPCAPGLQVHSGACIYLIGKGAAFGAYLPSCGKEKTATRILGTVSKCCPPLSVNCRALQSGKVTTVSFWCLGFLHRQSRIQALVDQDEQTWLDLVRLWAAMWW